MVMVMVAAVVTAADEVVSSSPRRQVSPLITVVAFWERLCLRMTVGERIEHGKLG